MDGPPRGRVRRSRLAAVVFLIVVGASLGACGGPREEGPAPLSDGASGDGVPARTARVDCDGITTQVRTTSVRPQPDGVHVLVSNTSGMDLAFQWELGGDNAPEGEHELVLQIAPGAVHVRCQDPGEDAGAPGGFVALDVLDPEGLYVPTELACHEISGWFADFGEDATGDPDPVRSVRDSLSWLRPDDVVERAGYPDASPIVRVVRDGDVIASVWFMSDGTGGWLQEHGETCEGLEQD